MPKPTPKTAEKSWLPTKKWWAALTGNAVAIIVSWVATGAFDDVERGMVVTAVVSLATAYWKSNGVEDFSYGTG